MHFEVIINEPVEKVWDVMLGDKTYRKWTAVFNPGGSWYEGSWEKGADIRFYGPDQETGEVGGMVSRIADARPHEFISIEHVGIINKGVVDTTSDAVKKWAPAFENYTFTAVGNSTHLAVDQDIDPDYKATFEEMWPKALQALKELAEKS